MLIAAYEVFENIRYYNWKSIYRDRGDLYGNLTVLSPNKDLIWEYRPYGECASKTREYEGHPVGVIKTNRYGFRDYDYQSTEKPPGTYRIAFIGDSVLLGLWVEYDKNFVKRFESMANDHLVSTNFQALNFGIDGYNTLQIFHMLKDKALKFSPDKVVYVMCLNDFDFEEATYNKIKYFKKPKSFLIKRIKNAFHRFRLDSEDYHIYYYNKNKKVVFSKIIEMKNLLQQIKVKFQVVLLPCFYTDQKEFRNYPLSHMHDEIKIFFKKNNINVFDLLEVFKKQNKPPKVYAYDIWHPNEEGHRLIAHALLEPVLRDYFDAK
jgi:lysophospholipase L1-like esterase